MVFNKVGYVIFGGLVGKIGGVASKIGGVALKIGGVASHPCFLWVTNWILSYLDRGLNSRVGKGGGRVDV